MLKAMHSMQYSQFRSGIPSVGHNYSRLSWWMRDVGVDWTVAVEPQRLNRLELPRCLSLSPVITERHTMRADLQHITIHLSHSITIHLFTRAPLHLRLSTRMRAPPDQHQSASRDNAVELIHAPITTFLSRRALSIDFNKAIHYADLFDAVQALLFYLERRIK